MSAPYPTPFSADSGALPQDRTPGSAAHPNRFQNSKTAAPAGKNSDENKADKRSESEKSEV